MRSPMGNPLFNGMHGVNALNSTELQEAERFFDWALRYEQKGLKIAADAMRDEGRKSFEKFLLTQGQLVQEYNPA